MVRTMKWISALGLVASLTFAPMVFAANVEDVTNAEIQAHHITVSNWSLLISFLGYHAVSGGHLNLVTRNIDTFWKEVGSSNPGDQSLSHKVEELNLLAATARLADAQVAVVNAQGQGVSWQTYMKTPHTVYRFAVLNRSNGQVLSTITVPWADPSAQVESASKTNSAKAHVATAKVKKDKSKDASKRKKNPSVKSKAASRGKSRPKLSRAKPATVASKIKTQRHRKQKAADGLNVKMKKES